MLPIQYNICKWLKNFISCLKAARAQHFSSASGPLLWRPAIFQWLTASLYRAFNTFARSFHPGRLNFEGFCIPNISLPLVSIAFNINVNKSSSLFASAPLLTGSSPKVPHLAYYPTSDRTDMYAPHLHISNLCAWLSVPLCCESLAVGQNLM